MSEDYPLLRMMLGDLPLSYRPKRPRGRPKKPTGQDDDTLRAHVVEEIRKHPGMTKSNRFLIEFAQKIERARGVSVWEVYGISGRCHPLFGHGNLEFSVSRGRRKLNKKFAKKPT